MPEQTLGMPYAEIQCISGSSFLAWWPMPGPQIATEGFGALLRWHRLAAGLSQEAVVVWVGLRVPG